MADTLDGVNPALAGYWRQIVAWLAENRPEVRPSITSGARTIAEQEALREANGCAGRVYDRSCKGSPTTAIPSPNAPHVRGGALDVADGTGDRRHVMAAVRALGLPIDRPVPGEPWHLEIAGDAGDTGWDPDAEGGAVDPDSSTWSLLTDSHTYWRVGLVLAGLILATGGLWIIAADLIGSELA